MNTCRAFVADYYQGQDFKAHNFTTRPAASVVILLFPDSMNRFLIRALERVLGDPVCALSMQKYTES